MAYRIVIANRVHGSVVKRLQAYGDLVLNETEFPLRTEELRRRCSSASAVMAFMTERVDEEFLSACPHLKIVAGALKGHNNIDVDACTRRNVSVTVVPDLLTEPTAELTVGLIIALLRKLGPGDRLIRSGQFHGWRPSLYGSTLAGATVGVLGAGCWSGRSGNPSHVEWLQLRAPLLRPTSPWRGHVVPLEVPVCERKDFGPRSGHSCSSSPSDGQQPASGE